MAEREGSLLESKPEDGRGREGWSGGNCPIPSDTDRLEFQGESGLLIIDVGSFFQNIDFTVGCAGEGMMYDHTQGNIPPGVRLLNCGECLRGLRAGVNSAPALPAPEE